MCLKSALVVRLSFMDGLLMLQQCGSDQAPAFSTLGLAPGEFGATDAAKIIPRSSLASWQIYSLTSTPERLKVYLISLLQASALDALAISQARGMLADEGQLPPEMCSREIQLAHRRSSQLGQ
jgi:hypothetical protein